MSGDGEGTTAPLSAWAWPSRGEVLKEGDDAMARRLAERQARARRRACGGGRGTWWRAASSHASRRWACRRGGAEGWGVKRGEGHRNVGRFFE